MESEIGRVQVCVFEQMKQNLKPKERINSKAYLLLAAKTCTHMSYRDATEMLRLFLHREEQDATKLRTLSDAVNRIGKEISEKLERITAEVLWMFGFNPDTGLPQASVELSDHLTTASTTSNPLYMHQIQEAIDIINQPAEEKISLDAEKSNLESELAGCVYISVDEIGVKRQKDTRTPKSVRSAKYVENTVIHIQYGSNCYVITANGVHCAMKSALAFLIANGLLCRELVFFTDGARNIKNSIETLFAFHSYVIILDWFHLKKKCQEHLSMALKGKEVRNDVLAKLLCVLWHGQVDSAVKYLQSLSASLIKNSKWLDSLIQYLKRKQAAVSCYALRAVLGLRNSSNLVERANDLLVAQRQKHNGMSWSIQGSGALASITMIFQNKTDTAWFHQGYLSFSLSGLSSASLCA